MREIRFTPHLMPDGMKCRKEWWMIMSMRFRFFTVFLALILAAGCPAFPAHADTVKGVSAQSAILMEAESGTVLWSENADARLPMASTTKIMTALVALEAGDPDDVIRVPPEAVGTEGSSVYLVEGEELTLEQLLYALLLESANDAAVAIACGVAGSVEAFAGLMNRKAQELGLCRSHFTNPHGLDNAEHYTTARELAVITRAALENDLFRTIVSTRKTTIPHAGTDGVRLLINHNKLLRLYDGAIGVKTGYTKHSGRCLVSAANRDGVTLIAVTLNAPDDWSDHASLLNYGFSLCESVPLCEEREIALTLPVVGGLSETVSLCNTAPLRKTLPAGYPEVTATVEAQRFLYAPVAAGDVLGKVVFRCDLDGDGNREIIGSTDLTAQESVEKIPDKKNFFGWIFSLFGK